MRISGGGFNNYSFNPGIQTPNYLNKFEKEYPDINLDAKSIFILNCFSEFHVKLIEQSMISFFKPSINDVNTPVSFSFSGINIETYQPSIWDSSHPITVYNESGEIYNRYSSINKASVALGVPKFTITYHRNIDNRFIYCSNPKLLLRIVDETFSSISKLSPISSHLKLNEVKGIDLSNIPENEIQARLVDSKDLIFETFSSASEFAKKYGLNPWQAYRYLNLDRPICLNSSFNENKEESFNDTNIFVFLCCNPVHKKKLMENRDKKNWPVVSVDTLNNNKIRFHETPSSARSELSELVGKTDLKPTRNFTKDYITGSSPRGQSRFLRRFNLMWLHDYKPEE
jgi:hypothetical protein